MSLQVATAPPDALVAEVRDFIADLLARYRERFPWRPPIHPEALAALVGARVYVGRTADGTRGVLIPSADGFAIRVNEAVGDGRTFTIAHEVGHRLFFAKDGSRRSDLAVPPAVEERLCDYIAANVLMPEDLVRAQVPSVHAATVANVLALRRRFAVSVQAAARRVACDLFPTESLSISKWRLREHERLGPVFVLDWAVGPRQDSGNRGLVAARTSLIYRASTASEPVEGIEPSVFVPDELCWVDAAAWTTREPVVVFAVHRPLSANAREPSSPARSMLGS